MPAPLLASLLLILRLRHPTATAVLCCPAQAAPTATLTTIRNQVAVLS